MKNPITNLISLFILSSIFINHLTAQNADLCLDIRVVGDEVHAHVKLQASLNLASLQFTVKWDKDNLQLAEIISVHPTWKNKDQALLYGLSDQKDGILRSLWTSDNLSQGIPFQERQVIYTIKFNRMNNVPPDIIITDEPMEIEVGSINSRKIENVEISFCSLSIDLNKNSSNVLSIKKIKTPLVIPNPTIDQFSLTLFENASNKSDLSIFNMSGKNLLRINNYASGELVNIGHLPPGPYYVSFRNAKQSTTTRLVKM